MKTDERRSAVRHVACVPADVKLERLEPTTALIAEISVTGALLFTCGEWQVGETVELSLQLEEDGAAESQPITAKVVRVAMRDLERSDLWGHTAAVQFDASRPALAARLEAEARGEKTWRR